MENQDNEYMKLAIELARRGCGNVEPNPIVGCVIVQDGQVIGKGWHRKFGGPHAEVNALSDCWKSGHNPKDGVMYVSLEPCSHYGKTGPCSKAVIEAGIKKVFIASEDPAEISGGGIEILQKAGIEVVCGLCRDEAEELNRAFYKHARTGLPWVILKWAQSIDGKLAWKNPPKEGNWISNEQSRADVHILRKTVQGILTGVDTVIADNPRLTVRIQDQDVDRPPLRIVLDSRLRMPWDCHLITVPDAPTVIFTTQHTAQSESQKVEKFIQAGIEVIPVSSTNEHCDLNAVLCELGHRGIQRLLIEAGPVLISEFLRQELTDEVRIYIAPILLGNSGNADLAAVLGDQNRVKEIKNLVLRNFGDNIALKGFV